MNTENKVCAKDLILVSTVIGAATLVLYLGTLAPTFGWGDSADLAMRMVDSSDQTFRWGTRDYALYRLIGQVFQAIPVGDSGTRANMMTAFFGAISVGLVAFLTGLVTESRFAAAGAALSLAVSHSFWFLSVTAEVYTFNLALVYACFSMMAIWYRCRAPLLLPIAAVFAGLALSHHATGLVLLASTFPLLVLGRSCIGALSAGIALIAWAGAGALYWQRTGVLLNRDVSLRIALGLEPSINPFYHVAPLRESAKFLAYAAYNFAGAAVLLVLVGVRALMQKRPLELIPPILWTVFFIGAGVTSSIPDKFNIYVMVYPFLAILVGLGLAHLQELRSLQVRVQAVYLGLLVMGPIAVYATTVAVSRFLGIDFVGAREVPFRDNAVYFLWPPKNGDYGPRRYAEKALKTVDLDAIVIADYTLWRTLLFMQNVESLRRDVQLVWVEQLLKQDVAEFIARQPANQPIYLAANTPSAYYQLDLIKKRFALEQDGVVFRVLRSGP